MRHELNSIFRNILKNKGTTVLNIIGLTTGFACSLLIVSWILHQTTFDDFVKNKESIYRVTLQGDMNGISQKIAGCFQGVAEEAMKTIPEVEEALRLSVSYTHTGSIIKTDQNSFFRVLGMAADSSLFNFFPYKIIAGNGVKALSLKNTIVIDEDLAKQCFGNELAIGKSLYLNEISFTVAAVMENIPTNSHLEFRYLISTLNMDRSWQNNKFGGDNALVYLRLKPNLDAGAVHAKINKMLEENIATSLKGVRLTSILQPLSEIPYQQDYLWDYARKVSKKDIFILSGVAFLIWLIVCINFANLFISTVIKRKKAIGVKIVSGAAKRAIIKEYLIEVLLYVLFSFVLSNVVAKLITPYFNQLSGVNIETGFWSIRFLAFYVLLIIFTTFVAGIFPSLYMYRIHLVEILKGDKNNITKGKIQQILISSQYVISIVLLVAVICMFRQVNFLLNKDLGFDKENIICLYSFDKLSDPTQQQLLKEEMLKSVNIKSVAYIGALPTEWSTGSLVSTNPSNYNVHMEELSVGKDYFDLSGIRFVEGDNIFRQAHDSLNYCIINEVAAKALSLKTPYVGQVIYTANSGGKPYIIKGVIANVNTKSLAQFVGPCFYLLPKYYNPTGIIMFKTGPEVKKAVGEIQTYWQKKFPDRIFEYWFLDQKYRELYKTEEKARAIISWFTAIAFLLTTLGLFAVAYFMTEKRIKEIGVRKINGATIPEVISMLNRDFLKWVVIAFVIATPIAWYAMNRWLENFAYKTTLSWWIFALAGLLALGIALLTVSWQSWKAATRNPVEALRYE